MARVEINEYLLVDREMEIYGAGQKSPLISRVKKNPHRFLTKINSFFRKDDGKELQEIEYYKRLAKKDKSNPRIHLKLADLYQKRGESRKAIAEYLTAAEIFVENGLLPQAMALYKRVLKDNPQLEDINWKLAEIYGRMGFLGEAFRHYNQLLNQYEIIGSKDKIQEILRLLVNLDPQKFMLNREREPNSNVIGKIDESEKAGNKEAQANSFFDLNAALQKNEPVKFSYFPEVQMDKDVGFGQIIRELRKNEEEEKIYPHFYFHLGVACWEMGFIDEAIEHLQESLKREEGIFEAARMLGKCYKEKGWWEEARAYFYMALKMEGIPEEKKEELAKELAFVKNELAREKQILGMLNTDPKLNPETLYKRRNPGYFAGRLKIEDALPA
ncbi:MAG: tetratricopeptide repeat protein [Thermodesulfobacteriota bacterium]